MSFLYSNDERGRYPKSWYAASTNVDQPRPWLTGRAAADVCIIGAGFTGLSAALHLAKAGLQVIVLDAHRAGFGASGRNGGQVGTGFNWSQVDLEKKMGIGPAKTLWSMTEAAKALTRKLAATYAPDAGFAPGVAHAVFRARDLEGKKIEAGHLAEHYGYHQNDVLGTRDFSAVVQSKAYKGGVIDWGAGHLHPLRYVVGLARAAERAGAIIHETSPVQSIKDGTPNIVHTDRGQVHAQWVIHATNGYHMRLNKAQAARVMPINNYLVATEPLDDPESVLAKNIAVADEKFVLNYYRLSHDNRLIFGGGESYGAKFPSDIFHKVRRPLRKIFPQLRDVELTHAWGGTLGITPTRLPFMGQVGTNQITASGFSGHGVALGTFSGKVMADLIIGQEGQFALLSDLPVPRFPGGPALRAPIMTLAMTWFSMRDKLGL